MSVTSISINGTTYPTIAAAREALDAMEEEAQWVVISRYRFRRDGSAGQEASPGGWGVMGDEGWAHLSTFRIGLLVGQEKAAELAEAVLGHMGDSYEPSSCTCDYHTEERRILSLARAIGGAQ